MSRKITFVAVFAVALTFAVDSQAFAKGGKGGSKGGSRGGGSSVHNHRGGHWGGRFARGFGRRSDWGYASYSPVDYGTYAVEPEVIVSEAPVVEAPIVEAPVYTTCEPVCSTFDGYGYFGGHRGHDFRHNHGRNGGHRQGGHGGHTGHGKK